MKLPTQLTVLRIILVPVFFVLFAIVQPPEIGWAVLVFAIAAVSDWWDGHIARRMNLTSELGAFLDPLADKLLTGSAFLAFAWNGYIPWWMVAIVLVRDVFLTVLRSRAERHGMHVRTSYFAKVKTFSQMTFILLVLALQLAVRGDLGTPLHSLGSVFFAGTLPVWIMGLVTLLTFTSGLLYAYDNWYVLRAAKPKVGVMPRGARQESA